TTFAGDRAEPVATEEDIEYILAAANRVLARPLTRDDVVAVYAGLRPLVEPQTGNGAKPTTKLSREHVVDTPVPGLASIAGGKFTTYRLMARDVVDAAVADFDRPVPGSVTDRVPLLGADALAAVQPAAGRLAEDYGVARAAAEVSAIMGRLLGWSRRRRAAETRRYLDLVRAGQPVLAIDPGPVPDRALAG